MGAGRTSTGVEKTAAKFRRVRSQSDQDGDKGVHACNDKRVTERKGIEAMRLLYAAAQQQAAELEAERSGNARGCFGVRSFR